MPTYSYKGLTESGSRVTGTVQASTADDAQRLIIARGHIPRELREGGEGMTWEKVQVALSTVRPQELILFTKQFRTMLNAGLSIMALLEVLENQTENPRLRKAVIDMRADINHGASLFQAFSRQKRCFTPLYCALIRAGEQSGTLSEVLNRLVYLIEHDHKVKKDIRSALMYPVIVIIFLIGAFLFLLTFVIPKFAAMFAKSGVALPWPTRVCITIYETVIVYWPVTLAVLAGVIFSFAMWFRTPQGRYVRDYCLLRIPILGKVLLKAALSRFASIFAILQASGITVLNAVTILEDIIGNAAIAREFSTLREKLEEGRGISAPLKKSQYFTPLMINMIAIGEESGNLDEMLREVAAHYDDEVEYSIGRMSELIGPLLIVGLAVVVGFFALSVFMPLYDMIKVMKH